MPKSSVNLRADKSESEETGNNVWPIPINCAQSIDDSLIKHGTRTISISIGRKSFSEAQSSRMIVPERSATSHVPIRHIYNPVYPPGIFESRQNLVPVAKIVSFQLVCNERPPRRVMHGRRKGKREKERERESNGNPSFLPE